MADFDPEAYVAQAGAPAPAGGFDPAAYAAQAAQPIPSQPAPSLGAASTGAFHFARHLAGGLGDKIIAAEQALLDHGDKKHSFGERYGQNLAFNDRLLEDSDAAHPVARWVGNGLGLAGNTAALAAVAPARAAAGLGEAATAPAATGLVGRVLQGSGQGAKLGAALGAVGGFGASRGEHPVADAALGAAGGAVLGGALGGGGGGLGTLLARRAAPQAATLAQAASVDGTSLDGVPRIARGVRPTPEALALQRHGVPLTLGQMQPGGVASEIEEAAGRVPILGHAIKAQRDAAEEGWRNAVLNQARLGEGPRGPGGVIDELGRMKAQFNGAYGQIAESPVPIGAIHPDTGQLVNPAEAFSAILKDPSYQATDADMGVVHRVLKDQLGKLYRSTDGGGKPIKAGLLMDMRSDLRQAAQDARLNGNHATGSMFQDAADSVGGGLKAGLSGPDLDALNQTDAAYSRFLRVADAAKRAGRNAEEGEFGPKHLSAELEKSYGRKFAMDSDAGGSLRELARAGKSVFTPRAPLTGHGELLRSALGAALGPLVHGANESPAAQSAFMRAAQSAAENGQRLIQPDPGALERALSSLYQSSTPGAFPAGMGSQVMRANALRKSGQ